MKIERTTMGSVICLAILLMMPFPTAVSGMIDVQIRMNEGGFTSYDHFNAELYLNNQDVTVRNAQIFGIIEILDVFYFWPEFTVDLNYDVQDIMEGEMTIHFLEFDFPDIDDLIPFGPMNFWGAWVVSGKQYGYDVQEFWLDEAHRWTPTPVNTGVFTSTPTFTPVPSTPTGFVYIAPGSYTMGSPTDESCRDSDESEHEVTLTNGFYMLTTEVTRQMWADLRAVQPTLPNDPSVTTYSPTINHPVQQITWYEAVLFANLMSVQFGLTRCYYQDAGLTLPLDATNYTSGYVFCDFTANGCRLPTEAEWEYACRAGTTGPFSCSEPYYNSVNCGSCWGGTHPILEQYCVYCANDSGICAIAGSQLPNPAGLYDIHGNVWEWCWDWYGSYPSGSVTDPEGPSSGQKQVIRGGSMGYNSLYCRSACRTKRAPARRSYVLGFRLVLSSS